MIGKGKRLHELQRWDVRNLLYVSNQCQRKVITGVNNFIEEESWLGSPVKMEGY